MKNKKVRWYSFTLGVVLIVVVTFVFFASRPSIGKIEKIEPQETINRLPSEKKYEDDNIAFTYNAKYEIRVVKSGDDNWAEVIKLLGVKGDSSSWTIVVKKININDLAEVSAVQFRRIRYKDYLEEEMEIDQIKGLFFKKVDGGEYLVLAIKDGWLVTVALTVNSNDELKGQEFVDFVGGIRIK